MHLANLRPASNILIKYGREEKRSARKMASAWHRKLLVEKLKLLNVVAMGETITGNHRTFATILLGLRKSGKMSRRQWSVKEIRSLPFCDFYINSYINSYINGSVCTCLFFATLCHWTDSSLRNRVYLLLGWVKIRVVKWQLLTVDRVQKKVAEEYSRKHDNSWG